MGSFLRLRDFGFTYGGLTGKTKSDFGKGSASFVTFLEVVNNVRLRGSHLQKVCVGKGESQHRVMRDDVLFNGSSETPEEVALSSVVHFDPEPNTYLNSFCFGYRLRSVSFVDPTYLAYFFRSSAGREMVASLAQGATRYNIAKTKFLELEIDLPSMERQRAIATAISQADDQVAALERLIAKKQAIKQGMMQQLLTGNSRLRGFSAPWVESHVGQLLEFKNGLNKSSEYFGSGTPIVNFMDVMNGPRITAGDVAGRVTLTRDEIKRFSAKRGDLFFTRTSETVDEVGTAAVLVDDIPDACFSGFVLRGRQRSRDVDSRFLARTFQLGAVRAQVTSSATYTTRALTNGRSLGRVVIALPPLDEQRAIATVLDDGDTELGALRSRLAKARDVKTGMMQQLLGSRTRLPVESAT